MRTKQDIENQIAYAAEQGLRIGMERGMEKGMEKGLAEGSARERARIADVLKGLNVPDDVIAKAIE